ncbi:hypothetical protein [Micromonospora carbonacea]|uniref:Uncharacterized protein n=1 Tax=Micromonospora carbonacea TaxID=47853 RepID=A0A7H8XW20_9ACTN|nr:hypothetical protein [Micromonospora carbonacea]MBB5830029.1 hypothetical protein [Micromonospora carbonacea]QLD28031.1 hypothetical protein HXZ27_30655 [Micromonospora carbonacea]
MDVDVTSVATAVVPFVTAAVGAYGAGVLTRVQDAAADATLDLGGQILRRLTGREEPTQPLSEAVRELALDVSDGDRVAAVRLQIRKILAANPQLATELAELVSTAGPVVTVSGERAIGAATISGGMLVTGDNAQITR